MKPRREIGLAVIGCGRIGGLRAKLAAEHPAVRFIATADARASAADALAGSVGGLSCGTDAEAAIRHPGVTAVVVSTSEGEHVAAVLAGLDAGKAVLVEKPLALDLDGADAIVARCQATGTSLHVAYSRRFRKRYHVAREQILRGRLGRITGIAARVYNSRSQALAMLARNPHATPVVDALTYYVDLVHWFLGSPALMEVTAVGERGVLAEAGYQTDDVTFALLRYQGGAVVNLNVCYALPAKYPALGHAARCEILGTEGVLLIDDDHTDQVMYSERGVPHVYLPEHAVNAVFLSSGTPGDWALGELIGPVAAETRAWLDHLATGRTCHLATPAEARATLAATLAIERAARDRSTVRLSAS